MKKLTTAIAVLGLFMAASPARATAPDLIPVQGVLLDSAGDPVDTTVSAVFSIYTTETGGTALYTETQSVLVEDGLFTAYIGDVTTLDLTTFRDNDDLWLGINIDSDGEMPRVYLGSVPFAGYAEWCGNHPTPDFADITGTVDASDLPSGVVIGALSCSGTDKVSGINTSGALVCSADVDTDTNTTYSAGTGLTLSGTTFSANTSVLQARVTGSCPSGQSIREIDATGGVTCEVDDGAGSYSAGYGLDLSGTTFLVDPTDFFGSNSATETYASSGGTSTGSAITIRSASITVPQSGHIIALGKTGTHCNGCAADQYASGYIILTDNASENPSSSSPFWDWYQTGNYGGGSEIASHSIYRVFDVSSSGTYTYYMRARQNSGPDATAFWYTELVLFFVPN